MQPGFTLADATGTRRIQKLEEGIANIDEQVTILMDKRYCMEHEIRKLREGC